jgi:hypothetical protein
VFQWYDGRCYEGQFSNSRFHGEGRITYPEGNSLVGTWRQGQSDVMKAVYGKPNSSTNNQNNYNTGNYNTTNSYTNNYDRRSKNREPERQPYGSRMEESREIREEVKQSNSREYNSGIGEGNRQTNLSMNRKESGNLEKKESNRGSTYNERGSDRGERRME